MTTKPPATNTPAAPQASALEGKTPEEQKLEAVMTILNKYDKNNDCQLQDEEIAAISADLERVGHLEHDDALKIIRERYAVKGKLTKEAVERLKDDVKSTETTIRYMAYCRSLSRVARYLAYTSDFGEAFRPVAHINVVRLAYLISWGYVFGDVGYEAYKMKKHKVNDQDLYYMTGKRLVFQSIASMALPAVTIHTVVHHMKHQLHNTKYAKYGPSACGLAIVPFLPLYDHPVERLLDWISDKIYTPTSPYLLQHQHD